ncbi:hypothetical protein CCACVL1_07184 [Corchorus capsularis]|uniref:UDP-glucuronosyl/UDP-glucosyltransferase n=1 Tax=Corchorus capsularis TaxID=210143 RepID=A0A1R3J8R4_COCAP|nr:hypothetical protein CCACVL1_07184 [Corchorus capsularis]
MEETIVLYPPPGLGVVSMVELGKLVLHHRRCGNHQFTITILLTTGFRDTPTIISYIDSVSQAYPSISFLDNSQKCSRAAIGFQFIRLNAPKVLHSLEEILKSYKISAFVIDIFCTSALSTGKDLKIPHFTSIHHVLLPLQPSFSSQKLD